MEDEGGKLPEAYEYGAARYRSDLPPISAVAERVAVRSRGRLGSRPVNSRKGVMLVENRSVSRILGVLLSPLSGGAIFEGRSCMSEKLGERIGAASFSLVDDPHVVRGMGSRLYDGDGRPTQRRTLVDKGILQTWFLDLYNARRLKRPPTVGSTSNLIVAPGGRTPEAILGDTAWAIHVDGFLGGNSNPATGRFSFGIRGTLWEQGQPVAPVSEMNITGSIFDLLDGFLEAADDPWHTGACRSPSLLFDAVQFSGA
jgi:PmbA protein